MINVNCYIYRSNKKKLLLKQTEKDTYLKLIHKKKGNIFNEQNMKIINSRTVISNNKRSFFQLLVKNI